jgi:ribosomal protein L11 methyltransferase
VTATVTRSLARPLRPRAGGRPAPRPPRRRAPRPRRPLGAVDEGASLTTYLPEPPEELETFLLRAASFLSEWLLDDAPPELSWRWQDDEDWARTWREGLEPRQLTERLVVKPTWTEWSAAPGEVVIDIDPQMAFGTGEHATTRGCLRLLDRLVRPGDRVLDVGSGSRSSPSRRRGWGRRR